eukprot:g401.t1
MDVHTAANSRLFITRPRGLRKRGHRSCRRKTLPPKSTSQSSCIRRTTKTLSARRDNVDLADRSREMFENLLERSSSYSKRALDYWETSDEKMAVMAFVLIGCVFLSALNATLGALEDMPLTGVLLKIIGLTRDENGTLSIRNEDEIPTPPPNLEVQTWVQNIPFKRIAIWLFVGLLAHQLKDFFGIAMGTFVISAIGNNFADSESVTSLFSSIPSKFRRRVLTLVYFSCIVSLLTLFGSVTIPGLVKEGIDFVNRLQNENIWIVVLEKMRNGLGDNIMQQIERFLLLLSSDDIIQSRDVLSLQVWSPERMAEMASVLKKLLQSYTDGAVKFISKLLSFVTRFVLQMVVSLVLSFLYVWDAPQIRKNIKTLKDSRLSDIYLEVAPSFHVFSNLFGKALQAQALIAMVNTALTAMGLWILEIPNIGFMSLFVFICGFIPIAGVFLSTLPMAFVAVIEHGFLKLAALLVMVTGIHFIEAYGLNPVIYSAHLKLHPLLVLSVLVVAEHLMGVWGLMLAVPLTVFALDYVIKYPESTVPEVAAKALDNVLISRSHDHPGSE